MGSEVPGFRGSEVLGFRGSGVLVAFLFVAFALRLAFGLASELFSVDQIQIYLIGLKYYTTGVLPDFGADIVYTRTQLPGAMQGLLTGGPFFLVAQPEAPYVLINLMSLAALSLLAWYIGRRLPDVPRWFLWPWIFFAPWTLNITTGIINTSYMMCGSIVFFVSVMELLPGVRRGIISLPLACFGAGFGLLWVPQFHLSYALLVPFAIVAMATTVMRGGRAAATGVLCFLAGAALPALTLVPTLLHHGTAGLMQGTGANTQLNPENLLQAPLILLRFLSFGSFELLRFIGAGTDFRLGFLAEHLWAAPFALFAGLLGAAQIGWLLWSLILPVGSDRGQTGVRPVRRLTLLTLALMWAIFLFSIKEPVSHTYYVTLPIVMVFSFYCWRPLLQTRRGRWAAAALLICGAITHVAIAIDSFGKTSLYTNRAAVVRALEEHNHRIVGERRPDVW